MAQMHTETATEITRNRAIERYAGNLAAAGVRLALAVKDRDWSLASRTSDRVISLVEMSIQEVLATHGPGKRADE